MRTVLCLLTRPNDPVALAVTAHESAQPDLQTEIVDLTAPHPDYAALLEKIFSADSVQVW